MKKQFYLFHRTNSKTGIRLGAALGWVHGSVGNGIPDNAVVVRWGNIKSFPEGRAVSKVYNTPNAIRRASVKDNALLVLKDKNVPCLEMLDYNNVTLPAIGRTRVHERRQGLWRCTTPEDVARAKAEGAEYFVRTLDEGFMEYRVHVFLGKAIRCVFKESWEIERTMENPDPAMLKTACDAVFALGLDMGAVDIVRTVDGKWVVLEVNTAPEVDAGDLKAWLSAFHDLERYHDAWALVEETYGKYPNLVG